MVDDIEHINRWADLHPLSNVERTRQPRVPDVGCGCPAGIVTDSRWTVFSMPVAVIIRSCRDVERPPALHGQDVGRLQAQGKADDSAEHKPMPCITQRRSFVGEDIVAVLRNVRFEDIVGKSDGLRECVGQLKLYPLVEVLARTYLRRCSG